MAKAKQIQYGRKTEDPQTWLADLLRVRFEEVLEYRESALDPMKQGGVHDMRVAIRRFRSAVRNFAQISTDFPLHDLQKELKKLASCLGAVRDADVMMAALEKLSAETDDPGIRDGIGEIVAAYREQREKAHRKLERTMSDKFVEALRDRFEAAIEASLRQRELFQVSGVREAGGRIIDACLADFVELSPGIYYPTAVKKLHRLRIAGKHLRYAIDLFLELFGDKLAPFAEETRTMQSYLGEVHDCDVWLPELRAFLTGGPGSLPASDAQHRAAAWLISQLSRNRTKAYRSALELWNEWETKNLLNELQAAIA